MRTALAWVLMVLLFGVSAIGAVNGYAKRAAAPPPATAEKEPFVVTFMIHVHDKDTVVEIESKAGRVQKFRGDQEAKIKEALDEGDHYIDILEYRDQKLKKVIFKQKVKEGRDA